MSTCSVRLEREKQSEGEEQEKVLVKTIGVGVRMICCLKY